MKNSQSFILLIGDDGALLLPPASSRGLPLFAEGHGDEQAQPLLDALHAKPFVPVLLLADTLAQELRYDTLPRLSYFDRRKLLARRLRQHFPDPTTATHGQLTAALQLKKNAALFFCLHDGGPVTDWMRRLDSLPNVFRGVALLPLEGAGLFRTLAPDAAKGWSMLLSLHRTGGFRQIVTHDGELVFTRLTPPLPPASNPSYTISMLTLDIQATVDYLARHGLAADAVLRLVALLPKNLHEALRTLQAPIELVDVMTPRQAARQLRLAFLPESSDPACDAVFAGWVSKVRRLRILLMPTDKKRARTTATIKKLGTWVALVLWGVAFFTLGIDGHDFYRVVQAQHRLLQEVAALETQFSQEHSMLAPVTEPLGRLRQAVARQRLFTSPALAPWSLFDTLNNNIGTEARVTQLDWRYDSAQEKKETLRVELHLTPMTSSSGPPASVPQAVVQHLEQMAQRLRAALPGYVLSISRYPFLVKSDETLSNDGGTKNAAAPIAAEFLFQKENP